MRKNKKMHSSNFYHLNERQFITTACVHAYFNIKEFYEFLGSVNASADGQNLINIS